jgi:hypothetical protein
MLMMAAQEIPPTKGGRRYRKMLSVLWITSIGSITFTLRSFANDLMDAGLNPLRLEWKASAVNGLMLACGGMICWLSYRGSRHNLMPPEWATAIGVGLVWVLLLLNRFG